MTTTEQAEDLAAMKLELQRLRTICTMQAHAIKIASRLWQRHNMPPCMCQEHIDYKKVMQSKIGAMDGNNTKTIIT